MNHLSSAQVNADILALSQKKKQSKGVGDCVQTGINFFDSRTVPMTRGNLGIIVGETNNGKSPLAATIIYNVKNRLKATGSKGNVVVFMTEDTVEKKQVQQWNDTRVNLRDILLGHGKTTEILENVHKSNDDPIYYIGDSADIKDTDFDDDSFGVMTPTRIGMKLQEMILSGIQPELVVIDHIHDLFLEKEPKDESELYMKVGRQIVQLSVALRPYCPLLAVCQAKQEIASRPDKNWGRMPRITDILYMSILKTKTTHGYSITYPKKYMKGQEIVGSNATRKAVTGIFGVGSAKFRDGDSGDVCLMTAIDSDNKWSGLLTELLA